MFQPSLLPEDLGVPLMDFAKWVGHLKPGRIVYASPNASSNWDLLLRLNWSEIGGAGLEGSMLCVIWKTSKLLRSFEKTVMEVCVLSAELSQECGHHLLPLSQEPRGLDHTLGSTPKTIGRSEFLLIFQLNAAFDLGVSCLSSPS